MQQATWPALHTPAAPGAVRFLSGRREVKSLAASHAGSSSCCRPFLPPAGLSAFTLQGGGAGAHKRAWGLPDWAAATEGSMAALPAPSHQL